MVALPFEVADHIAGTACAHCGAPTMAAHGRFCCVAADVHQEIHRKFELVNSHVELEHPVDPVAVGAVLLGRCCTRIDRAYAEGLKIHTRAPARRFIAPCIRGTNISCGTTKSECRRCHPSVDVDDISEHRKQYSGLKERLGDAAADKAADRLDFPDDHRRRDAAGLRARCDGPGDPQISQDVPAQIPYRVFPDPAAIDIETELRRTLNEDKTRISRAQGHDDPK